MQYQHDRERVIGNVDTMIDLNLDEFICSLHPPTSHVTTAKGCHEKGVRGLIINALFTRKKPDRNRLNPKRHQLIIPDHTHEPQTTK